MDATITASPLLAAYLSRVDLSPGSTSAGAQARPQLRRLARSPDLCLPAGALVSKTAGRAGAKWLAIVAAQPRPKRQTLGAPLTGAPPAQPHFGAYVAADDSLLQLPPLDTDYFTPDPPGITSAIASKNQTDTMRPREWREQVLAINGDRKLGNREPVWWAWTTSSSQP